MPPFAHLTRWPYPSASLPIQYALFSTPERVKSIAHFTGLMAKADLSIEIQHTAMTPSRLAESLIHKVSQPVIFCGDGWTTYQNTLRTKLGDLVLEPPAFFHIIRAASIGELARRRFVKGISDDPRSSSPLYLRPSEAEINYPHMAKKSSEKPQII